MTLGLSDEQMLAEVTAWVEREIGPVRRIARQGRWRPVWLAEAERDGELLPLYIRGDRGARWPVLPLPYEAKVLEIFAANGVRVPRLYGYIESVPAIVMERAPGRVDIKTAASEADRDRLREQLADQMRLIHDIDPALIAAAGSPDPKDPRELAYNPYGQVEAIYLSGDRLPSPDLEFARRWVRRNLPPCLEGPSVITMDAGQFIFEGDRLTAMLDFEFVVLGDRHTDFAALRTRTRFEYIGDLEAFHELYHARGGPKIDMNRVSHHAVAFALYAPMEVAHDLANPLTAADYVEYLNWHFGSLQDSLSTIASILGVRLEPYELPEPSPNRDAVLLRALEPLVVDAPAPDEWTAYRRSQVVRARRFLELRRAYGSAVEAEYLADVAALTGYRARDEWDADLHLEAFVEQAGPELDEPLLRLLHRRAQRMTALLEQQGRHPYS